QASPASYETSEPAMESAKCNVSFVDTSRVSGRLSTMGARNGLSRVWVAVFFDGVWTELLATTHVTTSGLHVVDGAAVISTMLRWSATFHWANDASRSTSQSTRSQSRKPPRAASFSSNSRPNLQKCS